MGNLQFFIQIPWKSGSLEEEEHPVVEAQRQGGT